MNVELATEQVSQPANLAANETKKPWEEWGVSRATYYRYMRSGDVPRKYRDDSFGPHTQRQYAEQNGFTVRFLQRVRRAERLLPRYRELGLRGLIGFDTYAGKATSGANTERFALVLSSFEQEFSDQIVDLILRENRKMDEVRLYLIYKHWQETGSLGF
jgi:hypothetical protein